jgi:hypothetical protein
VADEKGVCFMTNKNIPKIVMQNYKFEIFYHKVWLPPMCEDKFYVDQYTACDYIFIF